LTLAARRCLIEDNFCSLDTLCYLEAEMTSDALSMHEYIEMDNFGTTNNQRESLHPQSLVVSVIGPWEQNTTQEKRVSRLASSKNLNGKLNRDYIEVQGEVFSIATWAFMISWVLYGGIWYSNEPVVLAWGLLLISALQTIGGTVTMATCEIDVDKYLKRNQVRALFFVMTWIFGHGISAFAPPQPYSHLHWLADLPFLYLLFRFNAVMEMRPGFLRFNELFVLSLLMYFISDGSLLIVQALSFNPTWPYVVYGSIELLGAVVVAVVYHEGVVWSKWEGHGATIKAFMALYAFLFVLGVGYFIRQCFDTFIYHGSTNEWLGPAWVIGPVHFLGPPLMARWRPYVHGMLGRWWLMRRLRYEGTEFALVDSQRGSLRDIERVAQRIATHKGKRPSSSVGSDARWGSHLSTSSLAIQSFNDDDDLNKFYPLDLPGGDAYTLLILASGNGHSDAVGRLLDWGEVDVDKPSRGRRQTALFLASQNGHADCVRLLLNSGADTKLRDTNGFGPLYIASLTGQLECVQLLLLHDAVAEQEDMLVAAANGHRAVVRQLLDSGERQSSQQLLWAGLTVEDAERLYQQQRLNEAYGSFALTGGFACFLLGYVVIYVGGFVHDSTGVCFLLYALLQTAGMLIVTTAAIDVDTYFRQHRWRTMVLVLGWFAMTGLDAFLPPQPQQQVAWLQALPFLYLLWRFDDPTISFTNLFVLSLSLYQFITNGIGLILIGQMFKPHWPLQLTGGFCICGSLLIQLVFRLAATRHSTIRPIAGAIYTYLLVEGGQMLLRSILQNDYLQHQQTGHGASKVQWVQGSVQWAQWAFGPLYILPTLALLYFKQRVDQNVGLRMLKRAQVGGELDEHEIDERDGSLATIEAAICRVQHYVQGARAGDITDRGGGVSDGGDLNAYAKHTGQDSYTLLQCACWTGCCAAVEKLLALNDDNNKRASGKGKQMTRLPRVQTVQVDKGSCRRKWTALHIASWKGHLECVRVLLTYRADMNIRTSAGQSALFIASSQGHAAVVALLTQQGARTTATWMGLSAGAGAAAMGHDSVVNVLRAYESEFQGE
jgi:ankyrin repeat protein